MDQNIRLGRLGRKRKANLFIFCFHSSFPLVWVDKERMSFLGRAANKRGTHFLKR